MKNEQNILDTKLETKLNTSSRVSQIEQFDIINSKDKSDKVEWRSFGTDIFSDYVQQKKKEFREISTPNISIEKYNFKNNIQLTKEDRDEISLSNLIVPRVIETYDNEFNTPKAKAFGLVLKTQFKAVDKLSKSFRSIRFKTDIELPKQFNGPQIWKNYLSPITDQGKCGNCWAHASSAVLADRFAILSLGKIKFIPSPYEMTICSSDFQNFDIKKTWKNETELQKMDKIMHEERSCNGNNLYDTATSLFTDGVTEKSCFPDKFKYDNKMINIGKTENTSEFPYCYSLTGIELDTCIDKKTPMRKYRCKTAYVCSKENDNISLKEKKLMYDIYKYGPVIVGFMMYPDFVYDYDGKSIYTHSDKSGGQIGGHAVRLVGWGEEVVNGQLIKYWWIANSWGTDWGINGYFRMKRGMPEIQLEENVMSILPDFPGMIIEDPSLEAVETEKEKEIQKFTGHFLDNITGYYNTSIEKLKKCEIRGKMYPYINDNFTKYLPNYKEFFASKVTDYISSKQIDKIPYSNDVPVHYCNKDYTPVSSPEKSEVKQKGDKNSQPEKIPEKKPEKDTKGVKEKIRVCEVVNYKYFDIIYFSIFLIIGYFIYFITYKKQTSISTILPTSSITYIKPPVLLPSTNLQLSQLKLPSIDNTLKPNFNNIKTFKI